VAFDLGEHGEELVASEESHDLFRVAKRVIQHTLEQILYLQRQLLHIHAGQRLAEEISLLSKTDRLDF
jgi:hypothetical protein